MAFTKGYGKYKYVGRSQPSGRSGPSRDTFRVRAPVKSFRDLEVYQMTTQLSSQLFLLTAPKKTKIDLTGELVLLRQISKHIPRLIAESYGDKWSSKNLALQKLETAMRYISDIITKADFILAVTGEDNTCQEFRAELVGLIKKYQAQRMKIRNLKKAWERIA